METMFENQIANQKKKWRNRLFISGGVIVALYVLLMLFLPAPKPTVSLSVKSGALDTGEVSDFEWPGSGGAAIGAVGSGVLATHNADKVMPTASIAKVILVLAVLKEKPLAPGETGPTLTITDKDVALYTKDLAQNGSVVPVNEGEKLTEYQLLQALMLPSGNNIASTLAIWAFGSEQSYISYATKMLHDMGLSKTHLDDVSGYSPQTVSTPRELVVIGEAAIQNKVLASIVAQKQATLPVAGPVSNVNADLGQRDINGIKTGNTDQAGGCLLFSATRQVNGKDVTLVGAIQSLPDLESALESAPDLVDNGYLNFVYASGVPKNVGTMTAPWAEPVNIVAKSDISQIVWSGTKVNRTVSAQPGLSGVVGSASVGDKKTDLQLESTIQPPSAWWRLTHPLQILKSL